MQIDSVGLFGLLDPLKTQRYIHSLRCQAKRQYAIAYVKWVEGGEAGPSPQGRTFGLGEMGAQAVRFRVRDMFLS